MYNKSVRINYIPGADVYTFVQKFIIFKHDL